MTVPSKPLKELFLSALEIPADDRAEWLDRECAGDVGLREQLNLMLAAHDAPHSLLDQPSMVQLGATLDQPITEKPGTQIGPYKLLQQIGEGGMGVVYMAEQKEPLKRRVALKIIKPGMDTRQVIARFEAERQALAMMDHPNIAKVLDAGATESGRPYFVMELVNGLPVTKYCDEQHLTPKERLELFVPICQAVQHAHQKGIIHRDLKPSNILVAMYDNKAVPKIIDFGVAKATSQTLTDKTMFTQLGQVVGTLEYMSPEQAKRNQLDVDTRSDIYSLGVVLYELLTGETPFDRQRLRSAAFDEMLRIIREEEPSKPSTKVSSSLSLPSIAANRRVEPAKLGSMIRGELDWIVLKAMEKDRGRRYETASKFAEDVQHYLNDEPVVACPPSRVYEFRKFARRNRAAIAMSLTGLVLLLAVIGVAGWVVRDRQAWEQRVAREREERQARLAAQLEMILEEVDRLVADKRWPDALAVARRAEAVVHNGEADEATQQRVQVRLADLVLVQELEDARMQTGLFAGGDWDRAAAVRQYARAFRGAGVPVEGMTVEAASEQLRARPRILSELAAGLTDWSFQCRAADKETDDARWQHLLAVADAIDPDRWRRRVRAAWKMDEAASESLQGIANAVDVTTVPPATIVMLSAMLRDRVSPDEALPLLFRAQQQYPGDFLVNFELGYCLRASTPKRSEEAVVFLRVAYALRPRNSAVVNNLGWALQDLGRLKEAIDCYRRAIELDPEFAMAHYNVGIALQNQGRWDEAIHHHRRAIELDPEYAMPHESLGVALLKQGKLGEAINHFRQAIALDQTFALPHYNLGVVLQEQAKLDEAIHHYRRAIELDPEYAPSHNNLGVVLVPRNNLDEAINHFRQAILLDPEYSTAHENLGEVLRYRGELDEAIRWLRQAVVLDPESSTSHNKLGAALHERNKLDEEAVHHFRQAIELDPDFALAYTNLGIALSDQGNLEEAILQHRRGLELDPENSLGHASLGRALHDHRELEGAVAELRRAVEIDPKCASGFYNLGSVLYDLRRLQESITAFRRAVALEPGSALAHCGLGHVLSDQGELEEAIVELRRAIKIDPKYADAHMKLGVALHRQRNLNEAITEYRRALELDANDVLARFNLGMALGQQDKREEAIAEYRRILEVNPNHVEARRRLDQLMTEAGQNGKSAAEEETDAQENNRQSDQVPTEPEVRTRTP